MKIIHWHYCKLKLKNSIQIFSFLFFKYCKNAYFAVIIPQISQIQSQKSYVVGMGNQKYQKISQILKEHEENKRKIMATLAKQQQNQGKMLINNFSISFNWLDITNPLIYI